MLFGGILFSLNGQKKKKEKRKEGGAREDLELARQDLKIFGIRNHLWYQELVHV
jgi:hypothetical protein